MATYNTIAAPAEGKYTEKMSRFLAFAHPVTSSAEAKEVVAMYQNKFHDARHVCWAYMIGSARTDFMSNDNGEPSGTAGKPILGQINSFGLSDVVIVVVRYFGGIKLGTSGLIGAYRQAARLALEAATVIERKDMATITFTFPYLVMNDVMRLTKNTDLNIISQIFDNSCEMTVSLPSDDSDAFKSRLHDIDGVSVD